MIKILTFLSLCFCCYYLNAQTFKPEYIEINFVGETLSDVDLEVEDVFDLIGFPALNIRSLSEDDFEPNFGFNSSQNAVFVDLGFRLFKAKDFRKSTTISAGIGYGKFRGFSNVFLERTTTQITRIIGTETYTLDSVNQYAVSAGYSYKSAVGLRLALQQALIKFKTLSLSLGFGFDIFSYQNGEITKHEMEFVSYSDHFTSSFVLNETGPTYRLQTKMFSASFVVPISLSYNPESKFNLIDKLTFNFRFNKGLRLFSIPNVQNFRANFGGIQLGLGYTLS